MTKEQNGFVEYHREMINKSEKHSQEYLLLIEAISELHENQKVIIDNQEKILHKLGLEGE